MTGERYHIASGRSKKAGQWVPCPATIECTLKGSKHISAETYKNLKEGKGFSSADSVFEATEANKQQKAKKEKFDKEAWLEQKEAKLKVLHEELQDQISNLDNDEDWKNYLNTMSKFHRYSWGNQLLIRVQKPEATKVAGFNKWKELDRNVKKGEKGLSILAPSMINTDVLDSNGNKVMGKDGKPLKEKKIVGYRAVSVFDISQTEGKDLPTPKKLTETPPEGFKEDIENAIKSSGYTLEYKALPPGLDGSTNPTNKVVTISSSLNEGQTASVLAHELGHIAAGHTERKDYHTGHGGQRGAMEVEAESIAYVLCRSNGMSTAAGTESSTYVAGWAKVQKEEDTVKKSAEKVAKVVGQLLSKSKWRNVEED